MTKKYGLIGYPLSHSFSQRYFTEKFAREKQEAVYENFPIASIEAFPELIQREKSLFGLNVTSPYKQLVIPYLDELSSEAKAIGAVNVIRIERFDNRAHLCGYNSDVVGFKKAIEPSIVKLYGSQKLKALILGTGGASKAVKYAFEQLNIEAHYVSRKPQGDQCFTYEELSQEVLAQYRIVVNATPLGMFPEVNTCPEIPFSLLNEDYLLFDLVYNPQETLFLHRGKEKGAHTINGLEMLYGQAEETWRIFE